MASPVVGVEHSLVRAVVGCKEDQSVVGNIEVLKRFHNLSYISVENSDLFRRFPERSVREVVIRLIESFVVRKRSVGSSKGQIHEERDIFLALKRRLWLLWQNSKGKRAGMGKGRVPDK